MRKDAWANIVLEPESKGAIREALAAFERGEGARHLILHGASGTGKTALKKVIGETCDLDLVHEALLSRFDLQIQTKKSPGEEPAE